MFFEAGSGSGRSRAFVGGAGAKILYLEPESNKKISRAGAEDKWLGSATRLKPELLLPQDAGSLWSVSVSLFNTSKQSST